MLSSTQGHFLVYFCRPRTPLSTASALISSAIMSSTKFLDEKFHFFSTSQDLSTWLPPAPRFWLEVPMCQYAGEDSDTSPHRTALGKFWGLFRGRGTPFWARTLSLIHLFRSTIVKPSWSHVVFGIKSTVVLPNRNYFLRFLLSVLYRSSRNGGVVGEMARQTVVFFPTALRMLYKYDM